MNNEHKVRYSNSSSIRSGGGCANVTCENINGLKEEK